MSKQTLFAYAQGTVLEKDAEAIERMLDELVAGRTWISRDVWVVNQRFPPDWEIGLNLEVAPKRTRSADWTEDLAAIATALGALHRETGRPFVIGIHDAKTDTTKDLFVVENDSPDLEELRAVIAAAV